MSGDKRIPNAVIRRVWNDLSISSYAGAKIVGLSRVNFWLRAKKLGLPDRMAMNGRPKWIPDEEFIPLWLGGVRSCEFRDHYGCSQSSPWQTARRLELPVKRTCPLITLAQYHEIRLGQAMARDAQQVNKRFAGIMRVQYGEGKQDRMDRRELDADPGQMV